MIKIKSRDIIHILDINRAGIFTQFNIDVSKYIKNTISTYYANYFNYELNKSQWKRLKYIVKAWGDKQGISLSINNW